ncbi:MAG: RHS repeat-associated core domain-containing protein, partial [Candidatus Brocadiia bacterium]
EKQSGTWNTVAEYKYDGKTRRVLKVVSNKGDLNGTTRFVWGGNSDWQCLEERDGSGNLVARFTYAPGYIDAVARQERDLNADDDFADDDEVVWYHSNTLYSVYALTDGSENVVERYRYDAYGACTVLDADFSSDADNASDIHNPYAFTGRTADTESTLMQYRHRYYAPVVGRFVSRDPQVYVDAWNLYCYVIGRATALVDPSGNSSEYKWCEVMEDEPVRWARDRFGRITACSCRYCCDDGSTMWRSSGDPRPFPSDWTVYLDPVPGCHDETNPLCFRCDCADGFEYYITAPPPEPCWDVCMGACIVGGHAAQIPGVVPGPSFPPTSNYTGCARFCRALCGQGAPPATPPAWQNPPVIA